MSYRIDSDYRVEHVLRDLGFSRSVVKSGEISSDHLAKEKIDEAVFAHFVSLDGDADVLSFREITAFEDLINNPEISSKLFRSGDKLDGQLAVNAVSHHLGDAGIFSEGGGHYVLWHDGPAFEPLLESGVELADLRGIHAAKDVVPASWRDVEAAHLTLEIGIQSPDHQFRMKSGQATIVSSEGHLLTADHVVRDLLEAQEKGWGVFLDVTHLGRSFEIPMDQVQSLYGAGERNDIGILQISSLSEVIGGHAFAKISDEAAKDNEPLMHVGQTFGGDTLYYSMGRQLEVRDSACSLELDCIARQDLNELPEVSFVETDAMIGPGYSGGGIYRFSEPTDILGSDLILTGVTQYSSRTEAHAGGFDLTGKITRDPELVEILDQIKELQQGEFVSEESIAEPESQGDPDRPNQFMRMKTQMKSSS